MESNNLDGESNDRENALTHDESVQMLNALESLGTEYLHSPLDPECSPITYVANLEEGLLLPVEEPGWVRIRKILSLPIQKS